MAGPGLPPPPRKASERFDDWTQAIAQRLGLYNNILQGSGSHTAAAVAGTYFLPSGEVLGVTGVGTLYPPSLIYLAIADYKARNGPAPKLRIRATLSTNDVAPTGTYIFGLYPVTRPATSGGAGVCIYTMGTVVTGSQATTISAPAADSSNVVVSGEFAMPADGYYVLGVVQTGTVAADSHMHMTALLQLRNA